MSDVLTLLKNDHQAVESLLGRFDDLPPGDRDGYFCEVVHTLVAHEVAEEMVVYPPVREQGANGAEVADARLGEQAEAEQLLAEMESQETNFGRFHRQVQEAARLGTSSRRGGGVDSLSPPGKYHHG